MDFELLRNRAYTPYSGEQRAVVVESGDGNLFPGVRIENLSYPLTIPAVQAAVYNCLSEGEQVRSIFTEEPEAFAPEYWEKEYHADLKPLEQAAERSTFKEVLLSGSIERNLEWLLESAADLHSRFPVSAVLETDRGLVGGVNIEGRVWEEGLCAERVAIGKALSYGISGIRALHLHTRLGEYSTPCGACRQVIVEHLPHHPVIIHQPDGSVASHFSSDLLPYSFKSDILKKRPGDALNGGTG